MNWQRGEVPENAVTSCPSSPLQIKLGLRSDAVVEVGGRQGKRDYSTLFFDELMKASPSNSSRVAALMGFSKLCGIIARAHMMKVKKSIIFNIA